ncbi:hypothetical protein HWV62_4645 [Athelia sp. TMB]|nr:hypothetical protein HWV62_4645 [Athelia sp. TMB]
MSASPDVTINTVGASGNAQITNVVGGNVTFNFTNNYYGLGDRSATNLPQVPPVPPVPQETISWTYEVRGDREVAAATEVVAATDAAEAGGANVVEIPHSLRRGPPTLIEEEDRPVPIESPPLPTLPEASSPRVSREDPQREGGGEPSASREDNKPLPDNRTTADIYRHANALHDEIERFHFLLREWKQRVVLHPTPDAHSPESSFPNGIVPLLFTVIEQALPCVCRGNTIDPPLISAWPKMWPWLKFYAEHARRRQHKCNLLGKFGPQMNWLVHDLVMDTVRVFTIYGHSPPNKLFEVFVSTPGLQSLLAAMWIDEVWDSRSLRDLHGCILPRALSSEAGSLLAQEIIDAYGGSTEEAAKLIPKRIRLTLQQESPHLDHLTNEFGVLDKHRNNKLSPFNPYLSPLPKSYLRLARDVILWLLELPPSEEERSKLACVCFTLIIAVITESPNYSCTLDVLSHEIPVLLYKASFLCSRGTNSEIFHQETRLILNQFLLRFLTHRPMLDLAREAARVLTRPPKRKHTALFTAHIKYFTDTVDLMWGRYRAHRQYVTAFACSNHKVRSTQLALSSDSSFE